MLVSWRVTILGQKISPTKSDEGLRCVHKAWPSRVASFVTVLHLAWWTQTWGGMDKNDGKPLGSQEK